MTQARTNGGAPHVRPAPNGNGQPPARPNGAGNGAGGPPRGPNWQQLLYTTEKGAVKTTLGNVVLILENDARYAAEYEMNEMSGSVERGRVPLKDTDYTDLRNRLEEQYRITPTCEAAVDALTYVAEKRPYHPVRGYLRGLRWDGVERIDRVAAKVLGAKNTGLHQIMMRRWFTGAVARPLQPGCKLDTMLVLQGKQGARKSTFFRTLAAPWFVDSGVDLQSKDTYLILGQTWLLELAELDSVNKASIERTKVFLSSPEDCFRAPYGRTTKIVKRSSCSVGTTNADAFLRDPTGHRRFWVMRVGNIDNDLLSSWRDQLWAEAVHLYDSGTKWHMTEEEEGARAEDVKEFEDGDGWEETVYEFTTGKGVAGFSLRDVWEIALQLKARDIKKGDEMRIGNILRRAGYVRDGTPKWVDGQKVRLWRLPDDVAARRPFPGRPAEVDDPFQVELPDREPGEDGLQQYACRRFGNTEHL